MWRALISVWLVVAYDLVAFGQQNSAPAAIARISLPNPAHIGMPIWMEVQSPTGREIRYPSSTTPNDFYCNEVEIKQNGHLLQPRIGYPSGGRGGPACGWLAVEDIATSRLRFIFNTNLPTLARIWSVSHGENTAGGHGQRSQNNLIGFLCTCAVRRREWWTRG